MTSTPAEAEAPALLTVGEVAARLRVNPKTAYRLCWSGELGSVLVRRRRLVPATALAAYLSAPTGEDTP